MGAVELLAVLVSLINAGVNGIAAAQKVSALIAQRRQEGKEFTREDLEQAVAQDDEARKALQDAIAAAG
jgi:hypothetical protein